MMYWVESAITMLWMLLRCGVGKIKIHTQVAMTLNSQNDKLCTLEVHGFEEEIENYNHFAIFACMRSDISGNLW